MAIQTTGSSSLSKEFERRLLATADWVRTHQERFWTIVGLSVITVAMAIFAVQHRQKQTEEAWNQLGPIQGQIMQAPSAELLKTLEDWNSKFKGTAAGPYAEFMQADLLYKTSDYARAAQIYGRIADVGTPIVMRPLALAGQANAEEMNKNLPKALEVAKSFTERYPDHFLAASMYLSQARLLEATGNPVMAATLYERFAILFPQSPWTAQARERQTALSGKIPTSATTVPALPTALAAPAK